jgi:DNA-directed RNA polymerase II subunit RPB2
VQTQIASFDEFVQNTIQELVDESPTLTLSSNAGAAGREEDDNAEDARRHEIKVISL